MKIIFVSNGLKVGGAEKFTINLINGFVAQGFQPILILLNDENPLLVEIDKSVKHYILKRRFRFDIGISMKIRNVIRREAVSNVICIETYPFFISKLLFLNNRKIRFFLSLHNSLPIRPKQHIIDILYLKAFRRTDTVIFICNYQKQCFREKYFLRPQNSVVIYNGIDIVYFSKNAALAEIPADQFEWKARMGLDKSQQTILMVGRLSIEKGHSFAIRALSHLHKSLNRKAHLVVIGTGPASYLNTLKNLSIQMGVEKFTHFLGASSEVRPYLLEADIFTLTSFSETFSIAALEAMACGLPGSLTNVGGASEMIVHEDLGTLSNSGDPESIGNSWGTMLTKSYNRAFISSFAISNFSKDKMMGNYLSLFSDKTQPSPEN